MGQIKKDSRHFSVSCCVVKPTFCIRSASSSWTRLWVHDRGLTRRDQGWMNTKQVREEMALRMQNGGLSTRNDTEKRRDSFLIWSIFDRNF